MAVQILNDMPDAAIHRGDAHSDAPVVARTSSHSANSPDANTADVASSSTDSLSDWSPRASRANTSGSRPLFIAVTIAVHVLFVVGFLSIRHIKAAEAPPAPLMAEIIDAPVSEEDLPPMAPPPLQEVVYSLPTPDVVSIELETSLTPPPVAAAISQPATQAVMPPMVESVEYVRPPAPVYPRESSRRHEYGTVLLRVLVDPSGRAAQILVERTSGHTRLDEAAREAVRKALFRPHEVNGVAQAAQVLIPIEFTRRG